MAALRITIALEFDGIDDVESDEATAIIDQLTNATMLMEERYAAAAVWVDDAVIMNGGMEVAA